MPLKATGSVIDLYREEVEVNPAKYAAIVALTTPTTAPTLTAQADTNSLPAGTYTVQYTIVGVDGVETPPSLAGTVTTTVGQKIQCVIAGLAGSVAWVNFYLVDGRVGRGNAPTQPTRGLIGGVAPSGGTATFVWSNVPPLVASSQPPVVNSTTQTSGDTDDYRTNAQYEGLPNPGGDTHVHDATAYPTPAAPTAPVITGGGAAGTTAYSYKTAIVNAAGIQSAQSAAGATAVGNATLDGTNYNVVTTADPGAGNYIKVYRTASAGAPATTGFVGVILPGTTVLNDKGNAVLAEPAPAAGGGELLDSWNQALKQGNATQ